MGLYLTDPLAIDVRGPVEDKSLGFVGGGFVRRNFNDMFGLQLKGKVSFDQPSFNKIIENFDQTTKIGGHVNDFDFGGVVP